jgi:DNA-directed RNA polymerase subunit RPC12/RpoP
LTFGKDTCSSCGKYTDITGKVLNEGETLYCRECQDKELKIILENFSQIKFYCLKCGSSNVTKDDPKTGISLTDVPNAMYASTFITCNDCSHRYLVNMEDQGKLRGWCKEL